MKKTLLVCIGLICSLIANAQKSTNDCDAEVSATASPTVKRLLVQQCLLGKSSTELEPTAAKKLLRNQKVFLQDLQISEVNSAGGVEIFALIVNPNQASAIKYLNIQLNLYNAVGDKVLSEIDRSGSATISYTGPLKHQDGVTRVDWGPVWYNSTGVCLLIRSISIDFMNGKKITLAGKAISEAIGSEVKSNCKPV